MKLEDIEKVAIIGAGTMGAGIGLCFALSGYKIALYDVKSEQLDKALARIKSSQKILTQEGVISESEAKAAITRIAVAANLKEALNGAQFVLEAVPEILDIKQKIFVEMEPLCTSETIMTSNTSGLSITNIASVCKHPERIGGMHWVNPPELVPLVEVIQSKFTADGTVHLIWDLANRLGKAPVLVRRDVPGFAMNRLQFAIFREALHLVETGVLSPKDVDRTIRHGLGFRYPWLGPLKTADLGGLDVFHSISKYLFKELSTMQEPPETFDRLIAEGKLGIKTGQGFYEFEEESSDNLLRKRDLYFIRQLKLIQELEGIE